MRRRRIGVGVKMEEIATAVVVALLPENRAVEPRRPDADLRRGRHVIV